MAKSMDGLSTIQKAEVNPELKRIFGSI